ALCEARSRWPRDYAAGRPSMGKTIDRHEMVADYLDEMRTDVQALRALAVDGAWHEEMAEKEKLRLRFPPPAAARCAAPGPGERAEKEKRGLRSPPPADELAPPRLERTIKRLKRRARRLT